MLRTSAIRTRSASDLAPIFCMMRPRWTFTVISLSPILPATCLFINPDATRAMISCSRGVKDSKLDLSPEEAFSDSIRL